MYLYARYVFYHIWSDYFYYFCIPFDIGNQVCPSLWVGTSTGDVTALAFSVPTSGLQRIEQAVMVLNTGMESNRCN